MFRESLAADAGMLFVYDLPGRHAFWMKNTVIPLDVIWLDENKTIVAIETMAPCKTDPCPTYAPDGKAACVIELNAGTANTLKLQPGDTMSLQDL